MHPGQVGHIWYIALNEPRSLLFNISLVSHSVFNAQMHLTQLKFAMVRFGWELVEKSILRRSPKFRSFVCHDSRVTNLWNFRKNSKLTISTSQSYGTSNWRQWWKTVTQKKLKKCLNGWCRKTRFIPLSQEGSLVSIKTTFAPDISIDYYSTSSHISQNWYWTGNVLMSARWKSKKFRCRKAESSNDSFAFGGSCSHSDLFDIPQTFEINRTLPSSDYCNQKMDVWCAGEKKMVPEDWRILHKKQSARQAVTALRIIWNNPMRA